MTGARQSGFVAPTLDAESEPWWAALAEQRLVLPRCRVCGRAWFPPTPGCPHCGATDYEVIEASGNGSVYSWVVVHRSLSPAFRGDVPYTIGLIELDEGPRLFGRVFPPEWRLTGGERVRAVYYIVEDTTLLGFELQAGSAA